MTITSRYLVAKLEKLGEEMAAAFFLPSISFTLVWFFNIP
jgi:hypothetical protein